ncbi:GNAT family N-acetyltransferase [Limnohabitans sp. JUR4]|uniref:GNAT family N-acetyltransferase n=1 Tax=Limnohabitans radicicola TaxID=2771427 RepID=A0A927FIC0_9BURK|nr:GNAT family N-acetyltransferase [Limnohabitans radicicola]
MLPRYLTALSSGWTPDADRDEELAQRLAQRVGADASAYLRSLWNPQGVGSKITLQDGREVSRLAHVRHWIVDDDYCGDINLRWQPGTSELPDYCDGHVGYAVVPWKRQRGFAASALRQLALLAPSFGLNWLDIAMSADNLASRRVAESAGAVLIDEYVAIEQGGVKAYKYRLACGGA